MRAFISITPPEAFVRAAARLQQLLPAARPVPPDNLHLTLVFLDDQPEDVLETVHMTLERLHAPPVPVRPLGLASLGRGQPRVICVEIESSPALTDLQARVASAAHAAGISLARRRFRPHITLARFPRAARPAPLPEAAAQVGLPAFTATGFGLYRSTLHPGGAVHDLLAGYALTSP